MFFMVYNVLLVKVLFDDSTESIPTEEENIHNILSPMPIMNKNSILKALQLNETCRYNSAEICY